MRHTAAIFIIVIIMAVLSAALPGQPKAVAPSPAEATILALINRERTAANLPVLQWNGLSALAARAHSQAMAGHGNAAHQFDKEDSIQQRLGATGLRFTDFAENVAVADEPEEAHLALMLSPGHRTNIMNPRYNAVGIGAIEAKGRLWVTEDFAWTTVAYNDIEFGQALINAFNRVREQKGIRPLHAELDSRLSAEACQAKGDARNVDAGGHGNGRVFLFTMSEPSQLPEPINSRLLSGALQHVSLGVCYSPDPQHGYANFWVVAVFPA